MWGLKIPSRLLCPLSLHTVTLNMPHLFYLNTQTSFTDGFVRRSPGSDALLASKLGLAARWDSIQFGTTPCILFIMDKIRLDPSVCSQIFSIRLDWASTDYNVFFHPLARFPGPKLWTACRLPFIILAVKGDLAHRNKHFHAKDGEIYRKHLTSYHLAMSLPFAMATRTSQVNGMGFYTQAR